MKQQQTPEKENKKIDTSKYSFEPRNGACYWLRE